MRTAIKVIIGAIGVAASIAQVAQYCEGRKEPAIIATERPSSSEAGPQPAPVNVEVTVDSRSADPETEMAPSVAAKRPPLIIEDEPAEPVQRMVAPPPRPIDARAAWAMRETIEASDRAQQSAREARTALRTFLHWQQRDAYAAQVTYQQFGQAYANSQAAAQQLVVRMASVVQTDGSATDGERFLACANDLTMSVQRARAAAQLRQAIQNAGLTTLEAQAIDGEFASFEDTCATFSKCLRFASRER